MVIALPSTFLSGPALTIMSEEVWGDDKLVHLLGLPVTNKGEGPLVPVCGTVDSECLSGMYPIPIHIVILKTPLVWRMNDEVAFMAG
jgi:hypothetical protein